MNYIRFYIDAVIMDASWVIEDFGRAVNKFLEGDFDGATKELKLLARDASLDFSEEISGMAAAVTENMLMSEKSEQDVKRSTQDMGQAFKDLLIDARNDLPEVENVFSSFADNAAKDVDKVNDSLSRVLDTFNRILGFSATGGGLLGLISGKGWRWSYTTGDVFRDIGLVRHAEGGFPDAGEFFIAREAGPELVGRIGGRNAVVNNDQIVSAVSRGVYEAVSTAMNSGRGNSDTPVNIYLDGRKIASSSTKYHTQNAMATGVG
jgi:hypothetical protein